jgi:hypothetical protein
MHDQLRPGLIEYQLLVAGALVWHHPFGVVSCMRSRPSRLCLQARPAVVRVGEGGEAAGAGGGCPKIWRKVLNEQVWNRGGGFAAVWAGVRLCLEA